MLNILNVLVGQTELNGLDINEILDNNEGESIVIGFHGAALSILMNYLDSSRGLDWFRMIHDLLPYIIRFDFEGREYLGSEELFRIERGY